TVNQATLIGLLNPVIRGWANYHQHAVATAAFERVDHEIWRRLWQWAKRRHSNKARDWIKGKYFPTLNQRAWTFAVDTGERMPDGRKIWLRLVHADNTKIRRHAKIRQAANPFDPSWKPYFVERAFYKKFGISRRQAGIKPSC